MTHVDYERLWKHGWGDLQQYGPVHRHNLRRLVEAVRTLAPREILDVGCGGGDNLAALAHAGDHDLHGVDISSNALKLAHLRVPSASLSQLDIACERLDRSFDLVISMQVVEHIRDDVAALRNMAAMTRRYLYVSTIQGTMRPSEKSIGHVRNYRRGELEEKIRSAGLRVVKSEGWGFPFYSPLYRSLTEAFAVGQSIGTVGRTQRFAASMLYQLYRLNWPGAGDVLTVLASVD